MHYISIIQSGREISAIILTDDYLGYKERKSPYNLFVILIFNESVVVAWSIESMPSKPGGPGSIPGEVRKF